MKHDMNPEYCYSYVADKLLIIQKKNADSLN